MNFEREKYLDKRFKGKKKKQGIFCQGDTKKIDDDKEKILVWQWTTAVIVDDVRCQMSVTLDRKDAFL